MFFNNQKKLICDAVDKIGCDGDLLESALTPEELKDALDVPIICARRLYRKVAEFKNKKNDKKKKLKKKKSNDKDSSDDSSDDFYQMKNQQKVKKIMKKIF